MLIFLAGPRSPSLACPRLGVRRHEGRSRHGGSTGLIGRAGLRDDNRLGDGAGIRRGGGGLHRLFVWSAAARQNGKTDGHIEKLKQGAMEDVKKNQ